MSQLQSIEIGIKFTRSCKRDGGGAYRVAAMKTGTVDAALIEAPYNVMLEREGFRQILFVGDLIPLPLAGFGTTLEKIRKQPDEVQRLVRATLRGIHYAISNKQESVKAIMDWAARRGKF